MASPDKAQPGRRPTALPMKLPAAQGSGRRPILLLAPLIPRSWAIVCAPLLLLQAAHPARPAVRCCLRASASSSLLALFFPAVLFITAGHRRWRPWFVTLGSINVLGLCGASACSSFGQDVAKPCWMSVRQRLVGEASKPWWDTQEHVGPVLRWNHRDSAVFRPAFSLFDALRVVTSR